MEPPFEAGEGWDYSDTKFVLVAMAVESVTGRPIYDDIRRDLLDPLGLANTVASDRPDVPGIANGYAGTEYGFALALQVNTSDGAAFGQSPLRMLNEIAERVKVGVGS